MQDADYVQPYQGMKGVEDWQPWVPGKDGGVDVLQVACQLRVRAHEGFLQALRFNAALLQPWGCHQNPCTQMA